MRYTEDQIKTINSLKKVDDNIYTLYYQNDYGRDELIKSNPRNMLEMIISVQKFFKASQLLVNPFRKNGGCVGITAFNNKDDVIFARNFDYKETNCLILWVDNKKGYKSLCMSDINFMAYGKKYQQIEKANKARLLAAPYTCMDGINEKGLAISIIEVKFYPVHQQTGKTNMFPNLMLRLALDTCESVEEVEKLFENYDMHGVLGNDYHYHVTDRNGNASLIEFIDNKMNIIRNNDEEYYPERFMYVPSFFVAKEGNNINKTVYASERYEIMKEDMIKKDGIYNEEEVMNLLERCKTRHPHRWMPHTVLSIWSVVYNLNSLSTLICSNNNFNDMYKFNLNKPQIIEKV